MLYYYSFVNFLITMSHNEGEGSSIDIDINKIKCNYVEMKNTQDNIENKVQVLERKVSFWNACCTCNEWTWADCCLWRGCDATSTTAIKRLLFLIVIGFLVLLTVVSVSLLVNVLPN